MIQIKWISMDFFCPEDVKQSMKIHLPRLIRHKEKKIIIRIIRAPFKLMTHGTWCRKNTTKRHRFFKRKKSEIIYIAYMNF